MTVVETVSIDGFWAPPMIVMKGQNLSIDLDLGKLPPGKYYSCFYAFTIYRYQALRDCSLMRPGRSTNFPTTMGLYLYEAGVRRRALDSLSRLGFVPSYTTITRRLNEARRFAEEQVKAVGRDPISVLTWDNFEFKERRRGERSGDHATFRSITTALVIESRVSMSKPLAPGMWRPRTFPLSAVDIGLKLELGGALHHARMCCGPTHSTRTWLTGVLRFAVTMSNLLSKAFLPTTPARTVSHGYRPCRLFTN